MTYTVCSKSVVPLSLVRLKKSTFLGQYLSVILVAISDYITVAVGRNIFSLEILIY